MEYSEFKRKAESLCTGEDEKKCIAAEFALFEERGWEKYVVLLSKILGSIKRVKHMHFSGSYKNSYTLSKVLCPEWSSPDCTAGGELFSDGLSFCSLAIWNPSAFWITRGIRKNDEIIRKAVDSSGLFVKRVVRQSDGDIIETTVVSTAPVPDEDVKTATKSPVSCTPEEKEKMKKYLIITMRERQI